MEFLKKFIFFFIIVFITSALVSFLYSLIIHSHGVFDWGTAVRLGIILGIVLPWTMSGDKQR